MPSEKHIILGHMALTWLANKCTQRGARSCVELTLGEGYVADAGAICGLQWKWEKHFGLRNDTPDPTFTSDYKVPDDLSWIFESKVSRADFRNTFVGNKHKGDRLQPRANFHFLVTEKGIITANEVPSFWGWLECSGQGLSIKKLPIFCPQTESHMHEFAYRILRYTTAWKEYNISRFERNENFN